MGHLEELGREFGKASPDHFAWQTEAGYVAQRERALVQAAFSPAGSSVLDVGCGEGATLYHLRPTKAVGVDLFEEKLGFARQVLPQYEFLAASAYELPFADASFDHVIVRDLIHHLEQPELMLVEAARVLEPGGRLDVLEPCGRNPLIALHALTRKVERGELRSTPTYLRGLVSMEFRVEVVHRHQALPIHRVAFHPQLGRPSMARVTAARKLIAGAEWLASKALPKSIWAYIHLRASRR